MKMKELLVLQLIGILLFAGLSVLLYLWGAFNIVTSIILYVMLAVGNVLNVCSEIIKPIEAMGIYDKLTGCYNRTKLTSKVKEYENFKSYTVIFFDVNNLKKTNDVHGHDEGDKLIVKASNQLKYWRRYGDLYRIGGDEFLVVIPNAKINCLESKLEQWYLSLDVLNEDYEDDFICKFSYGVYRKDANDDISFEDAMNKADENMYTMKKELKAQRE